MGNQLCFSFQVAIAIRRCLAKTKVVTCKTPADTTGYHLKETSLETCPFFAQFSEFPTLVFGKLFRFGHRKSRQKSLRTSRQGYASLGCHGNMHLSRKAWLEVCHVFFQSFSSMCYITAAGVPSGAPHFRGSPKAESGCCIRGADVMYFYWLVAATFFHIVCIYHWLSYWPRSCLFPCLHWILSLSSFSSNSACFTFYLRLQHSPSIKRIEDSRNRPIHSVPIGLCENGRNMQHANMRHARLSWDLEM
jgi:hypothetical protein